MALVSSVETRSEGVAQRVPTVLLVVLGALTLGVFVTLGRAREIWETGAFLDTDDALRMVQVRSLLAGQSWYDMTVARMDPPGSFMHWSRTVDIPLALLMKLFGLFADATTAEALTRLAFPLAMLALLYVAVALTARQVGDRFVQIAAICLTVATAPMFVQFIPGRIDHHAPQIVLLVAMTGAMLAAFDASRAKTAVWSGLFVAMSLSISVENLPFIVVLAAAPALIWIVRGDEQRGLLVAFASGLAASLAACFFATIGPQRWFVAACDAYSIGQFAAGLAGAAALGALALVSPRLSSLRARIVAALVAGLAPVVALKLIAPACFGDPFVGLDPLVREIWLNNVAEVRKLSSIAATQPGTAAMLGLPVLFALLASLVCAWKSEGLQRARLLLLAALIAVGLAMTCWAVRAYSSVTPLAAIGGAVAAAASLRALRMKGPLRIVVAVLAALPYSPAAFALALPAGATSDKPTGDTMACLAPKAMKPLDALKPGLVFAPIDAGSHLLAFTRHSVLGAPYHRNNSGNRLVIDAFLAPPDKAKALVENSGADYLVICPRQMQAVTIAERAPAGLAAALIAGHIPDWLAPIDIDAAPNMAFRVRR
ncbi:MAG: hypothetical protein KGM42_04245 [Hyphomicrobiales bacterium]|nr:hypothetical protein [Hyphomicrobiales bacterium]